MLDPNLSVKEMMDMVETLSDKSSNRPDGIDFTWWDRDWLLNYVETTDLSKLEPEVMIDLITVLGRRLEEAIGDYLNLRERD